MVELVLGGKFGGDDLAAARRLREQLRQAVIALGPDHEVDQRRPAHDLLAFGLGDATGDRDRHVAALARRRVLELADAAELRIDLLGGLLADMAGVEDDEIGILGTGFGVSLARQEIGHTMGIVDVHLAAIGFDVKLAYPAGHRCDRSLVVAPATELPNCGPRPLPS